MNRIPVLVAGMAGASLGTEIIKSLLAKQEKYTIYGCDVSPYAYGHYMHGLKKTFVVSRDNYVENIIAECKKQNISVVIPGGDEPAVLLGHEKKLLAEEDILYAGNSETVVDICSNKGRLFEYLQKSNISIPQTWVISSVENIPVEIPFPCIIKPATNSGGSVSVFIVQNEAELKMYAAYMLNNGLDPIVQEYLPHESGEYTVGVLHSPIGKLCGSIVLKRMFHAKVSIMAKTNAGLISSGYSQGEIGCYPDIASIAEKIACICKSCGPLNVQGRIKNGVFCPFEINPRFSASTFLRTLAGFNEIDMYIDLLLGRSLPPTMNIRYGYYLRSFDETYVSYDGVLE